MKKIILDTNFLIYCAKFRIDFFSEIDRVCLFPYKICVLSRTIEELEKVKPKELSLIKKYLEKIEKIQSKEKQVDKELIELSKEGCIVATQDLELKKKLTSQVIVIRQKKYLELRN
ncbi:ribonuclease VapC [Candidatus Woesearchaeota archaeon]|nr:ribonuclease VapC [Candidatus Woesearchaeota archaeon]